MTETPGLRSYHAPVWDEPVVLEMGRPGRRGIVFAEPEEAVAGLVGSPEELVSPSMRRPARPGLPELSEHEVLRHYLHLSQETLGMIGISLFGTCTMKYNPRLNELITARPEIAELHPYQDEDSLQGVLELIHGCDLMLRELSGMDRFSFQAGAAPTAPTPTPASLAATTRRGESWSSAIRSSSPSRVTRATLRPLRRRVSR